jgi:hypothetical protein
MQYLQKSQRFLQNISYSEPVYYLCVAESFSRAPEIGQNYVRSIMHFFYLDIHTILVNELYFNANIKGTFIHFLDIVFVMY